MKRVIVRRKLRVFLYKLKIKPSALKLVERDALLYDLAGEQQ